MYGREGRFSRIRWLQTVVGVLGMVGALALIGLGITGYGPSPDVWMVAGGGFVLFLAIMILTVVPLLLKMESTSARQLNELRDLTEAVSKHTTVLNSIAENTRISDAAKSVAHRDEELAALQAAIREAIRSEQWEQALQLVEQVEHRLGYRGDAQRFREELDHARNEAIQAKLSEAIALVEAHFRSYEWDLAQREMDRLVQALPDEPKVLALPKRMEALRQAHKEELMLAWDEAVRRNDTDQAIDVLKELDRYLSSAEAHALQSSARNVFKEKLLQLSLQFRFAVTEKRWQDALSNGLTLVRDFPNARMAAEVSDALETLRQRARQASETSTSGPGKSKT